MKTQKRFLILVMAIILSSLMLSSTIIAGNTLDTSFTGPVTGAIFTTTVDGSIVNENVHYTYKTDVYLDGGPGPNAPSTAAALQSGDYVYQVTDPSGRYLLSNDHISCRAVHVNEFGVISFIYTGTNYVWSHGNWNPVSCTHNQGTDLDYSNLGAITVQLYPFDDTPNKGGVYKVWMTPVAYYQGDLNYVPTKANDPVNGEDYQPGYFHGFLPRYSKTDNFKVFEKVPRYVTPTITVQKFNDKNFNGIFDNGDEYVTGWKVSETDPLLVTNDIYTEAVVSAATSGLYTFIEDTPQNTLQTTSYLNGNQLSLFPNANPQVDVNVAGDSGETHTVLYGDVGLGKITACKIYDANTNGIADVGEAGIAGWKFELTGVLANGDSYQTQLKFSSDTGCVSFTDLLPGTYTITEVIPNDPLWISTSPLSQTFTIESMISGSSIVGTSVNTIFTNYYVYYYSAAFATKGYWHNKNGLSELTIEDINYVNTLAPYATPSTYFEAGDEPFDGYFSDGTPVAAAFNDQTGDQIWQAGTWQSEVSQFLVDSNSGGNASEQLAQQLLAFIFNLQHRTTDGTSSTIYFNGQYLTGQHIIDQAINAWLSNNHDLEVWYESIVDQYNNNLSVTVYSFGTASSIYPPPVYI